MSERSESLTDRLARFTPNAGGLDRDALLFAAGQRSARPGRFWKWLALGLALTQSATIALLWFAPPRTTADMPPSPPPAREAEFKLPPAEASPDRWSLIGWIDPATPGPEPVPAGEFVPDRTPYTPRSFQQFD